MAPRSTRTFLTFKTKHDALRDIKAGVAKEIVMGKYKISERMYYSYLSSRNLKDNLEKIEKENTLFYTNRKKLRKCKNDIVDKAVIKWFCETRDRGEIVNGPILKKKSLVFNEMINGPDSFKASNGWLSSFKERYSIRITGEKVSNDSEAAELFSKFLNRKIINEKLRLCNIYNADESGIYWNTLQTSTLAVNREEGISDWRESEDRLTGLFCSNAAGNHRLPLLLVGNSQKPECLASLITEELKEKKLKYLDSIGVIYTEQNKSFMDRDLFILWYKDEFIPRVLEQQEKTQKPGKVLLLLDNAPSHPPLDELNSINKNFEVLYLPPNVTALSQPLAQGLITKTKKLYKKYLLQNLLIHDKTAMINFIKQFSLKDVFSLFTRAWDTIDETFLKKVWKLFLGDSLLMKSIESIVKIEDSQLEIHDSVVKIEDSELEIHDNIYEISKQLSNEDFSEEEIRNSILRWFDEIEENCGWEVSSDKDIVNFVTNGKQMPEIENIKIKSEHSDDPLKDVVSLEEAHDCLLKFKAWMQEQSNVEEYFPHVDVLQDLINFHLENR